MKLSRRQWLEGSASLGALSLLTLPAGCAAPGFAYRPDERRRIAEKRSDFSIVKVGTAEATVLRRRARRVPAGLALDSIAARMERAMRAAKGVGLAGPQVALSLRMAMLLLDWTASHPRVVFARNPRIVERSDATIDYYEGCLSIPGVGGLVRRTRHIEVHYEGPEGELRVDRARGPNAVLWQHEIDHLDGVLYTDRIRGELLPMDEVRKRRKAAKYSAAWRPEGVLPWA